MERRGYPRFITNLPLEISSEEFQLTTETKNISCVGILCQVARFIPVKTKLKIKIKLPMVVHQRKIEKEFSFKAEVSRIEPSQKKKNAENYYLGIAFSDISEHEKNLLLQFIHQKNIKEAKELKKMYLELKEMAARLVELEECHPTAEHFRKIIYRAIAELEEVAHILDHEISEIKNLET